MKLIRADRIQLSQERLANYGVEALPFDPWHIPVRLRYRRGGERSARTLRCFAQPVPNPVACQWIARKRSRDEPLYACASIPAKL